MFGLSLGLFPIRKSSTIHYRKTTIVHLYHPYVVYRGAAVSAAPAADKRGRRGQLCSGVDDAATATAATASSAYNTGSSPATTPPPPKNYAVPLPLRISFSTSSTAIPCRSSGIACPLPFPLRCSWPCHAHTHGNRADAGNAPRAAPHTPGSAPASRWPKIPTRPAQHTVNAAPRAFALGKSRCPQNTSSFVFARTAHAGQHACRGARRTSPHPVAHAHPRRERRGEWGWGRWRGNAQAGRARKGSSRYDRHAMADDQ
ncbi:hypothetical protein B0H11DRAFT_1948634 [Mycena galericulata]|nr:hypothetical protein B0H11DRAFT_1948634 [Mycena galericulata]